MSICVEKRKYYLLLVIHHSVETQASDNSFEHTLMGHSVFYWKVTILSWLVNFLMLDFSWSFGRPSSTLSIQEIVGESEVCKRLLLTLKWKSLIGEWILSCGTWKAMALARHEEHKFLLEKEKSREVWIANIGWNGI